MKICELIPHSGESTLMDYRYHNGVVTITLSVPDLDSTVIITTPARIVTGIPLPAVADAIPRPCFLDILSIADHVESHNGIFVPPSSFPALMTHTRMHLSSVYGWRTTDVPWLIALRGSGVLVSCVVKSLETVDVRVVEDPASSPP